MNQTKLKFARAKLKDIAKKKCNAIEQTAVNERELNIGDAIDRLASGKASLSWATIKRRAEQSRDWDNHYYSSNVLHQVIADAVVGKENKKRAAKRKKLKAKNAERKKAVWAQCNAVETELVLGDEQKALDALNAFALMDF